MFNFNFSELATEIAALKDRIVAHMYQFFYTKVQVDSLFRKKTDAVDADTLGGKTKTELQTEWENYANGKDTSVRQYIDAADGLLRGDVVKLQSDVTNLQSDKLGVNQQAADSLKLGGKTLAEVIADVAAGNTLLAQSIASDMKAAFAAGVKDYETAKVSDYTTISVEDFFSAKFGSSTDAWDEGKYHVRVVGTNLTDSFTIGTTQVKNGDIIVLSVDANGAVTLSNVLVDAVRAAIVQLQADVQTIQSGLETLRSALQNMTVTAPN